MLRILDRALAASAALGLASVMLTGAPAGAAVDCPVPGAPVVQQFSMTPTTLTAPTGDGTEHSVLAAQIDSCGAEHLVAHVDVTAPDGQTRVLEDFVSDENSNGTFGADLTWRAGDVGQWTFALAAETVDSEGVPQRASATLAFTIEAPPPAPVLTVPAQPHELQVAQRTRAGGQLIWQPPATDGGSAVTAYRIIKPGADVILDGAARSHTVSDLQPAQAYAVSVQAKNAQGYGPTSTVTLTTLATVPANPRAVKVSQRATTSGRVSWQVPASNGGSAITGYRIAKPGPDATVKATARSYVVKGLKPGRSYAVKVAAKNAQGYGPSSTVTLKTLTAVPAKPRALAVSKRTKTSAKVSWQAPASDGGLKITAYRIAKPGQDVTVKATARSYTVRGLKPGRPYTVKIKAKNARGYGSSAAVTFKTAPSTSCTPGYSPCLPPASDYDCAGGSGNGPKYASGPIYVTGSDPYDLDRDGDGVACES